MKNGGSRPFLTGRPKGAMTLGAHCLAQCPSCNSCSNCSACYRTAGRRAVQAYGTHHFVNANEMVADWEDRSAGNPSPELHGLAVESINTKQVKITQRHCFIWTQREPDPQYSLTTSIRHLTSTVMGRYHRLDQI